MIGLATITDKAQLLDDFLKADERALNRLYNEFRPSFIGWLRKQYDIGEEEGAEIYQKSFTILYYNIKDGKLTELRSSLKTYFFGIGRNVVREKFKDKFKDFDDIDDVQLPDSLDTSIMDAYHQEEVGQTVRSLLEKIGYPCKDVLTLAFFKNYSNQVIAEEMNYKDAAGVRKRKSVCLKQLRQMLLDARQAH